MDFIFAENIMKLKEVNPTKFGSNWSKESKEIYTKS